jgi:hypothetical protein
MLLPAYFESTIDLTAAYSNADIVLIGHYIDDHVQGMLSVLSAFASTNCFFHTRSIAKMGIPVKFWAICSQKTTQSAQILGRKVLF